MPSVSFNGGSKKIILSDVGDYSMPTIYSEWKRWVQSGAGAPYAAAFDTTGGDDIGGSTKIGQYFFLRTDNGWSIKLPEASGAVKITGNLFPRVSGAVMFTNPSSAGITVRVTVSTSAQALLVDQNIFDTAVEGDKTLRELMQLMSAALAGKISVSGNQVTIRDVNDTADRIVATTDAKGQRTAVTLST